MSKTALPSLPGSAVLFSEAEVVERPLSSRASEVSNDLTSAKVGHEPVQNLRAHTPDAPGGTKDLLADLRNVRVGVFRELVRVRNANVDVPSLLVDVSSVDADGQSVLDEVPNVLADTF